MEISKHIKKIEGIIQQPPMYLSLSFYINQHTYNFISGTQPHCL